MPIERRTLQKAPQRDVVESFTTPATDSRAELAPAPPVRDELPMAPAQATRRGPGRPRSTRRMEPFSSKIEISLRDQVDAYIEEHGGTMVDFLDAAIRDKLKK
jgi:hypothetical protein